MAESKFWFKHDYGARNDEKTEALIDDYGMLGYGVYWWIVERLHEENNHLDLNERFYNSASKRLKVRIDKLKMIIGDCVKKYELFQMEGETIAASRVARNLEGKRESLEKLSQIRSEAGKKGAMAKWQKDGKGMANDSNGMASDGKGWLEEIRVEENREDKKEHKRTPTKFIKPKKEEVCGFLFNDKNIDEFTAMGFADRFINYYDSNGWKVGKNPMKNWKAAVNTWLSKDQRGISLNFNGIETDEQTSKIRAAL